MNSSLLKEKISSGVFDNTFKTLYPGKESVAVDRYNEAIDEFVALFGDNDELRLFSAPGRTEIGGNHTDHQRGCVLAAGVDLDVIAVVKKNDENIIRIKSKGFDMDEIDLGVLTPVPEESEHAASLIRGVAARFSQLGCGFGGFDAYTTSNVLKGSGLSSSAAFEVLVSTILDELYNGGKMSAVDKAIVSQYAENKFFGKPCGLMDQMASSVGGFVSIDFCDTANPIIEKVDFDFASVGHSLCIVDTGGCHADLTSDFAGIPTEMKAVAQFFGKDVLREVDEQEFYANIAALREKVSDRAVLRAIHFFNDNRRAIELRDALKAGNFEQFKQIIGESGMSSMTMLQNVFAASNPGEQGLTLALALTARILGENGAWRVHGGGFAGTIQAFVPNELLEEYRAQIESVFGSGSCYVLSVRPVGGIEVTPAL
ncbi:MAG: galactokinase [Acutalibacteraceae bacterium]